MRLYCEKQSHCLFSQKSNTSVKHDFVKPICITQAKKLEALYRAQSCAAAKSHMGTLERLLQRLETCLGDQSYEIYYILYVNSQPIQHNYTSHTYTSLFCQICISLWIFIVNFPERKCTAL